MKRTFIDDYREHINRVELSPDARERIGQAIRAERETTSGSQATAPTRKRSLAGSKPSRRWVATAACVAALAIGGFLLAPTIERALDGGEHTFALAAYASGTAADASSTVKLALGNFAQWGGWFTFDEADWKDASPYENGFIHDTGVDKGYVCSAYFDLSCEGTGIASLTYELEGDPYFNFDPARDESTPPKDFSRHRFTIEPGDLKNPDKGFIYIVANVPAEGALEEPTAVMDAYLRRIDDNIDTLRDDPNARPDDLFTQDELDAYREARDQTEILVHTKAAEMIASSTLTVTATFDDGSKESHEYRIAPVVDFAERYQERVADGRQSDPSGLFTIEQLS